jgi:quercetin dioxygenase-like cupin family protein
MSIDYFTKGIQENSMKKNDINKHVLTLIDAVRVLYTNPGPEGIEERNEADKVSSLLDAIPELTGEFTMSKHPIVRHIEEALECGKEEEPELTDVISKVIYHLPWKNNYPYRKDAPLLKENIAFAEIIGPEAPFVSEKVCLGLTLIAPDTVYPFHKHPAIELYYTISGNALWSTDNAGRRIPSGGYVLHRSNVRHEMCTGDKPLLAVYSWSGSDVVTTSVYADD